MATGWSGWAAPPRSTPTNVAACTARICLTANGHVRVQSGSHEIGTGIRTVAAQMAAECLDIPIEQIEVEMGDSDLPPGPVAGGSTSTASVCSAIIKACGQVKARLQRAPGESLEDAFKRLGVGAIEEYAEFTPEGAAADAPAKLYQGRTPMVSGDAGDKLKYAFGAEFVEVRINRYTREIRVPRITGAFAAGRIMNTRTARSQLMGGMIWGIGSALHEITEIDERYARYVNRDLQDYLVPVNADIGAVDVILVPEVDTEVNPAGIKGLGELGNVGTPAAIAGAIYHATGKRLRRLPFRVEDLFGD
jgi:xanthine dehydrogenase YagR molybdenum-binding subunit